MEWIPRVLLALLPALALEHSLRAGQVEPGVDKDERELVQRLFAVATGLASLTEEAAVVGQSSKLTEWAYKAQAMRLNEHAARCCCRISVCSGYSKTSLRQACPFIMGLFIAVQKIRPH
jgi:hypothetical protein